MEGHRAVDGQIRTDRRAGLLVVEDAPAGQPWIAPLAKAAFPDRAVLATRSSREASATLARYSFEVALVDLQLQDGSGLQIIEQISRLRAEIQCVVVTRLDDDEHIFASLTAGAKGYLLKHQPRQDLIDQLRQLVQGIPALSPAVTRRLVEHFSKTSQAPQPRNGDSLQPRNGDPLTLSRRERDVLYLLARGQHIADVAGTLHISAHTVCSHIKNIYRKLDVSSRAEAALEAHRMGLV